MQRTILFSDIEGSTNLWERHEAPMSIALQYHDQAVRNVLEAHGAVWWKGTGDGVVAAFETSRPAVEAAVDIQRALSARSFAEIGALRARVGLHVGEVSERDGDLFGQTMNRAARLMGAAHGGQIVASHTVEIGAPDDGVQV